MSSYRYGFNGKELNPELQGATYDYGFRIYDARIGKFLSVDPLYREFSWNSPYAFAENRVMDGIDLEGKEFESRRMFPSDFSPFLSNPKANLTFELQVEIHWRTMQIS